MVLTYIKMLLSNV